MLLAELKRALRTEEDARSAARRRAVLLALLVAVSLSLRLPLLGNVFDGSDNAELAARVTFYPGYGWMAREGYGLLINVLVKLCVGVFSLLGITITEFWWKLPLALVGSCQAPVVYLFLRRLRCREAGAVFGGLAVAVLPLHVMQSRYMWGYEVLGVLFVTLAVWALLDFFESPSPRSAATASVCSALYLLSHNYIVPFAGCILVLAGLSLRGDSGSVVRRARGRIHLMAVNLVWLVPLLSLPVWCSALAHSMTKQLQFGVYVTDYFTGFMGNTGWPLMLLCAGSVAGCLVRKGAVVPPGRILALCGAIYLAPLFLLAPPGITVTRGYMLVGTYFWVLCAALAFGELTSALRRVALCAGLVVLVATAWGTVESTFFLDRLVDPAYVKLERGGVTPDPGSKAAGYLVRKHVPREATVVAVHRSVEGSNLAYYFKRPRYARYDLTPELSIAWLRGMVDKADVVVCGEEHLEIMGADGRFPCKVVLMSRGEPRMWLYARPDAGLSDMRVDVRELNEAFDRQYAHKVELW